MSSSSGPRIAVIYWSLFGHIRQLAETIAESAKSTGAQVDIFQVQETFSDDVLAKMHAAPRNKDHPVFNAKDFVNYDGFLFGIPTRYGRAPAQVNALFDRTGGLWAQHALHGKMAGIFTSTGSQHGGQETTALTTIPFFVHHGIIFVPAGYKAPELSDNKEIVGGSPYGAASIAGGDGSRQLTQSELAIAKFQGQDFAQTVGWLVKGRNSSKI